MQIRADIPISIETDLGLREIHYWFFFFKCYFISQGVGADIKLLVTYIVS